MGWQFCSVGMPLLWWRLVLRKSGAFGRGSLGGKCCTGLDEGIWNAGDVDRRASPCVGSI